MPILLNPFLQIDYLVFITLLDSLRYQFVLDHQFFILCLELLVLFRKVFQLIRQFFKSDSLAFFCLEAL